MQRKVYLSAIPILLAALITGCSLFQSADTISVSNVAAASDSDLVWDVITFDAVTGGNQVEYEIVYSYYDISPPSDYQVLHRGIIPAGTGDGTVSVSFRNDILGSPAGETTLETLTYNSDMYYLGIRLDPSYIYDDSNTSNNEAMSADLYTLPPDDPYEENDEYYNAYALSAGTKGTYFSEGPGKGIIFDDDWFSVQALAGESVSVTITFDNSLADLDLKAYGSNGSVEFGSSTSATSDSESITFNAPANGTYLFKIYQFGSTAPGGYSYDLIWNAN